MTTSPSVSAAGAGSAGQCYSFGVRYSTDDGNLAQAGTDGAIFAGVCLLDPAGDPIDQDDDGCLQVPAPGIRTYGGGALIAPGLDGTVSLPASGPPPEFGCGLTVNEDDELVVATSGTWPPNDLTGAVLSGAYTDGGEIACGPDGEIRGLPDHTALSATLSDVLVSASLIAVPTTYTSPTSSAALLSNPSDSRRMIVQRTMTVSVDLANQPDSGTIVTLDNRVNGGAWTNVRDLRFPESPDAAIRANLPIPGTRLMTIGPGDAFSLELRVRVTKTGSGADPSVIGITAGAALLGVTV